MKKNEPVTTEEFFDFISEFNDRDDRSTAIVGSAFLEQILAELLENFLIDDTKAVDTLIKDTDFCTKIKLAYCLGLINKSERQDLDTIRSIRNLFAHNFKCTDFNMDTIKNKCICLKIPNEMHYNKNITPREFFEFTIQMLLIEFSLRESKNNKCEPVPNDVYKRLNNNFGEMNKFFLNLHDTLTNKINVLSKNLNTNNNFSESDI